MQITPKLIRSQPLLFWYIAIWHFNSSIPVRSSICFLVLIAIFILISIIRFNKRFKRYFFGIGFFTILFICYHARIFVSKVIIIFRLVIFVNLIIIVSLIFVFIIVVIFGVISHLSEIERLTCLTSFECLS